MGDMADFALEQAANDDEHYQKFRDTSLSVQYEEGLVDEYGVTIGNPSDFHTKTKNKDISKKCPKCKGKYGHISTRFN